MTYEETKNLLLSLFTKTIIVHPTVETITDVENMDINIAVQSLTNIVEKRAYENS